jgi:phosphotransferase system HPr (HPr) family protein
MRSETIPIVNKLGLHARASAKLVELTRRFQCDIQIAKDHDTVDGKSILGLLMLAGACGESVEVRASGSDETEAMDAVRNLFARRFDEDE